MNSKAMKQSYHDRTQILQMDGAHNHGFDSAFPAL